jgi:pyruvate,water dikinase
VPAWFVVPPCVSTDAGETQRDLRNALERLCPDGGPVAVRSSAIEEDGQRHAYAGQFESFLNVPHADVVDRIAQVRGSAASDRAVRYRLEHRLPPAASAPSVLIQRMVHADVSGVAFSIDPVSGSREVAVVAAVRGLGGPLVSGEVEGETYHVGGSGPASVAVRATDVRVLDDGQLAAVAALARHAEQLFGCPQDIEWAIESGRLYLLQARPVTSVRLDAGATVRLWDNSNIIESYGGVTTPLTFSFARDAYEGVYRQFCRMMRVPAATIAAHDDLFGNMLGLIRGRVYYNLLNWYRLLALLPGFAMNRRFMEQMMGVRGSVPAALLEGQQRPGTVERGRDTARLVTMVAALAFNLVTLPRRTARFRRRLDAALVPPSPPLAERHADEIVAYYRDLRRQLLTRWDAPILNDFFAMVFYGALRELTARWCGDTHGTLQNDLIAGESGLISAEPAVRIRELAARAVARPAFVEQLQHGSVSEIAAHLEEVPGFAPAYDAYLAQFGERCADELKLETATLRDDPLPLLRAVGHLAAQRAVHARPEGRAGAEARVRRVFARRPLRRLVYLWVLRHARARIRDRENLRFDRTRLFGRVRQVFVELGRRLHAAGALDDARDIFYLRVDEVLEFVEGRAVTTDLKALAALRRAEFTTHEASPAPDSRFETRGVVYLDNTFHAPVARSEANTDDEQRGTGCCPGIRRGPVRVVRDPATAALAQGTILVAERTDPGWILIFPSAAGLIVERGSVLSHSAIVARELGIPAIVSVPGVTTWLKDGDWVEMDGSTGIVRKVAGRHD